MRMAHMVHAVEQRSELAAVADDPANRHSSETHNVIAALASDQAGPAALSPRPLVGESDLERTINRS